MVSEAELVRRCLEGESEAFGVLVERHRESVVGFCYHQISDFQAAQDLAQEVFLRAYADLGSLREPAKFGSWLRAIALRLCQSWHRRRREDPLPPEELDCYAGARADREAFAQCLARLGTEEALRALPETQRLTLTLRYLDGYSVSEMAAMLQVPAETIRTRLRRSKSRLKELGMGIFDEEAAPPQTPFGRRGLEKVELLSRREESPMPHLTDRVPFRLSPDGHWLAITVREPPRKRAATQARATPEGVSTYLDGSRVLLVETTSGETREPFPPGSVSWAPQWSPDGCRLAAFAQHEGHACVAVWEAATGAVRFLRKAEVSPKFEFEGLEWMPDGRRLVAKLSPHDRCDLRPRALDPEPTPSSIEVLSFDPALAEVQAGTPEGAAALPNACGREDDTRGDLAVIDAGTGDVRRLADGWSVSTFHISPDGHGVAVLRTISDPENPISICTDLVSVAVETGEVRRLAPRVQAGIGYDCLFNWSPNSQQIAFFHIDESGPSQLFVVPSDGSEAPRRISGDEDLRLPGDEYYHPPRWSPDGRTVYALWRGIWVCAADGSACRRIAPDLGRRLRSAIQTPPPSPALRLSDGRSIIFTTSDPATLNDGLARLDLETGEGELLAEFEHMWKVHEWGIEEPFAIELAPDGRTCYLALVSADHPTRIWRLGGDFRSGETLLDLEPEAGEARMGSTRLIEYRTLTSKAGKRRARVTLPPDYEEGQRLPVVVRVYHGASFSGWRHSFDREAHAWARRGYAYMRPDLPIGGPDLLRRMAGEVVPAVNHLIDLGIADPERICLYGHSRGGYDALALITQTNLFCAAVVSAGTANLTSIGHGWREHGCHGTLWDQRDAYIQNSPFFYLDRVQTPLLMVAGTSEPEEAMEARRVFGALRRLGKRVEVRLYRDEDHSPDYWTEENYRDLNERMVAWFEMFTGACRAEGCTSIG